jgi:hypothetical protein
MIDEKELNLTSFELADQYVAKVTKNKEIGEEPRAYLKDTLSRLRK